MLLIPLKTSKKQFFLAKTLEDLRRDEKWYGKACDAVIEYWRYKNNRKGQDTPATNGRNEQGAAAPEFADAEN